VESKVQHIISHNGIISPFDIVAFTQDKGYHLSFSLHRRLSLELFRKEEKMLWNQHNCTSIHGEHDLANLGRHGAVF
jgi:hypothetical protein